MIARRGSSGLSGILLIDKPSGMTSHDVVNRVRRLTGERRVGHAGTLDPMATGLLVVLVGPATRLAPYLTAAEKAYVARIAFGSRTDTDDAEGSVVETAEVPASVLDPAWATAFTETLVGVHQQVPPSYSAIKREGVTAYTAARKGSALELEPREVEITSAILRAVSEAPPYWDVELSVSKGTYIRAIARDVGMELNSAAHLSALRRVGSGGLSVSDAVPLGQLEDCADVECVSTYFTDPVDALGLPVVEVEGDDLRRVIAGAKLRRGDLVLADAAPERFVGVTHDGRLLAVYAVHADCLRAETVIPGGVTGGGPRE